MAFSGIFVLCFIAIFVIVVVLMIYASQKSTRARAELAQSLGFSPVETPDDTLLERIASVHFTYGTPRYRLRNVMRKSIPYGSVYLYDLWNTAGRSSSSVENGAVAVIAPGMNLPFFVVYPRLAMGGILANMANQFIENILGMSGLTEIDFPDAPELDEKFFIAGEDVEAVRALFTPQLAALVLKMPMFTLSGRGDTFSLGQTGQASKTDDPESIRALAGYASAIHDCLSRG